MTSTNSNLPLRGGHGGGGHMGGGHMGGGFPGRHGGGYRRGGGYFPRFGGGFFPGGYGGFNACGGCCPFGGGRIWANVRGVLGRKKAPAARPPAPQGSSDKPVIKRT